MLENYKTIRTPKQLLIHYKKHQEFRNLNILFNFFKYNEFEATFKDIRELLFENCIINFNIICSKDKIINIDYNLIFRNVVFEDGLCISKLQFNNRITFEKVIFKRNINFEFENVAGYKNTSILFVKCNFISDSNINGNTIESDVVFNECVFEKRLETNFNKCRHLVFIRNKFKSRIVFIENPSNIFEITFFKNKYYFKLLWNVIDRSYIKKLLKFMKDNESIYEYYKFLELDHKSRFFYNLKNEKYKIPILSGLFWTFSRYGNSIRRPLILYFGLSYLVSKYIYNTGSILKYANKTNSSEVSFLDVFIFVITGMSRAIYKYTNFTLTTNMSIVLFVSNTIMSYVLAGFIVMAIRRRFKIGN